MDTRQRNIGLSIVLTIFTCGIYGIYWFIVLNNDVKQASKDQTLANGGVAFLLTILTCGIYGYYWAYRMGKATLAARKEAGMDASSDNSVLYVVLQFFGLAIVNYALIQNDMNAVANYDRKKSKKSNDK